MQKFLRTLTFMALLLVPWVTQGQTVLFSEDFEGGTMPTGWTTDGPGTWSVATGDYSSSTGAGQGTYNAKITHSSTGSSTKLITPAIDFTGVSSAVLNYMHIQRSWAGDIDEMRVYYRTDTTGTWTLLDGQEFTSAVASWTTESDIVLPNLSSTYQIAFEYTDNYGYGIGIDNVIIELGASCVKPSSLAATLTPGSGTIATLNWTAGGSETAWVLEYSTASDFTGATSVNVTGTPTANLTGLTAEATYYARVKAVCSANDQSGWCNTVCTFTPTNAYSITINDSTATNGYVPIYGYYVDNNTKSTFIIPAADLAAMQYGNITKLTFYASNASVNWGNAQFTVYMTETTETTVSDIADFTSMEQVMTAGSLGISNNIMEVTLTSPYQYMGGNLMIAFDQPTSGSYVSCSWYGVSATGASVGGYGTSVSQQNFLPKMRIDYTPGQAPTCAKPTQLAVNYTGGTSATLSWTSDATMWNINVNGTVTYGLTANPTTLTGLDLATTYNIMLQANCGNDTSEWTNPVSFTTDLCMPENQCAVSIVLNDSYGDGWNGGQLAVVDVATQSTLGTYTLDNGSADTFMVNVCDGRTIDFVYTQGNYPTENGWSITDINEEVIAEHEGCSSGCQVASGSLATYTVGCTVTNCRKPADLAATEIANHSITLSWTEGGEATSWMLAYAVAGDTSFTQVAAATNPFTLTGLLAETAYTVKVRPVCSDELVKWSDAIVVTTDVACPAPTALAVNAGPVTAEISWNGIADNYTLQYAPMPTATSPTSAADAFWLSYNDSSYATGIGSSSSADWTWGVMYPSSMLLPGMVTKVSVYETANYYTSDYTVSIYSGSTTEPTTLLASQTVTPSGVDGFHEITLANPALVEASQNLWVVMNVSGSYVLSACSSTEPNNQWVYSDGWYNIGDLASSLAGYGWMINAEITPIDLNAIAWTTVNNATSPTTINGLTIETEYIARVKAICGGQDGESLWSNVVFSTSESNPIPTNVEVVPGASTADFSWIGYSDSYKVYYRLPAQEVITFSEDFEEGIDTNSWAIYTVGDAPQDYGWYTTDPTSGLSFNAQSGSMAASAWSWNSTAYNADNWLVTPQVTLNGTLRYWERTNNGYPDRYEVIVSTTGNTITDFANGTTIRAYDYALNNSQWNEVDIDLSAFNGQLGYIAFHHADTDANYLLIDNLAIVSDTIPAGAWVEVATTTANVTVTGLTPETTYEYRITGIYNNVENNGTEIATFTTDVAPDSVYVYVAVNDSTMGTTVPAPGLYPVALGDSITITATPNDGNMMAAWVVSAVINNDPVIDTITVDDQMFQNPMTISFTAQTEVSELAITALFEGLGDTCAVTLPYSENFDSYTGNATSTSAPTGYPDITLPSCWIFNGMSETTSTYPQAFLSSSTTYAVSGNCLFFKSSSTTPLYAHMPAVNAPDGVLELSFTYRNEGTTTSNGTIIVGLSNGDAESFVALDTLERTTTKTEHIVYVAASDFNDQHNRIAFKYVGGTSNNYYAAIDNVVLQDAPSCIPVSNLAAEAAITEVTLTWVDAFNNGATYTVRDVTGAPIASGISGTTYTVTGLEANTDYTFSVEANCSADVASTSVSVAAHTLCAAVAVPYSENFDDITTSTTAATGAYVDCWPFIMTGTSTYQAASYQPKVYYSSTYANSGSYSLRLYGVSYTCLPTMAEPLSGLQLTFNAYTTGASYKLAVGVMEGETFIPVDTIELTTNTHNPVTVFFGSYNGNSRTIAFRNFNTSATSYTSYIYIDDVVVDYLPSCVEVSNLAVSGTTSSSITLTWEDNLNNGATYTVSDTASVIASGITGTTYTVTGLASNTPYTFTVTANCSATEASDPVSVSGRTQCTAETLPFTETFDASLSDNLCWRGATGVTAAQVFAGTALTLTTPQWTYTSSVNSGLPAGHYYKNIYGASCKSWIITPAIDLTTATSAMLTFDVAFTGYNSASAATGFDTNSSQAFMVLVSTDGGNTWLESNATKWQNEGGDHTLASIAGTAYQTQSINLTQYVGNTIKIAFYAQSLWAGGDNNIHIDNIVVDEVPSCMPVVGLTATDVAANSVTLAWENATISGTWSVYNMADSTVIASGLNMPTYTVNNLQSNTEYIFGVVAVCGADEMSDFRTVSTRTVCGTIDELPYTCGFEADEIAGTASQVAMPWCWTRTTSSYTGTTHYPYSYSSSANTGSRSFYFLGTTSTATTYPDTMGAALPQVNIALFPLSGLQLSLNAKMGTATASKTIYVGTMTDPADHSSFTLINTIDVTGNVYTRYDIDLTNAPATDAYVAFYVLKGTGTMYIDDISLQEIPSCLYVTDLAASDITSSSVTLTWSDSLNSDATYTVYNDDAVVATGLTATTYTFTGLDANTVYNFSVAANCSADETSEAISISARTACGDYSLPFTEDFSANLSSNVCWRGATAISAAQAFAGTQLTLTTPQWSYASSARCGLDAGHYYKNIYGSSTSQLCWMITPAIDLTNVTSAQLSFDVALTDYNNAALPDANGDTNTSQAFMVIVSTDGGNTWSANNATVWQNVEEADYTFASLASTTYQNKVIDLTSYVGNTIKIAFYTQSLWSGGDNDLHIDNIAVTEVQAQDCQVPTITNVTYAPYNNGEGDYVATVTWNSTGAQSYEFCWNEPTLTRIINNGNDTVHGFVIHPNEASYVKVRAICGADNTSDWSDSVQLYVEQPITTDSVTVTFAVNDTTMGSVSPMGTVTYAVGDVVTMTATANEGYHLYAWRIQHDSLDIMLTENFQTSYTDTVDESLDGYIYTAYFEADSTVVEDTLCFPNPTSVDGSGVTSVAFGGMTNTTSHAGSTAAFVDNTAMAGSVPAGTTANVEITYATGYTYGTLIWVDWNNNLTFEGNEVVYVGNSTDNDPTTLTATFDIPATQALGSYRMRIVGADSHFDSYIGSIAAAAQADPCDSYSWGVAEDYTLTVTEAPACLTPTALAVNYIGGNTNAAELTWTSDASLFNISVNGTVTYGFATSSPATITGLDPNTTYVVMIQANCGNDTSAWTTPVTFTTPCVAIALPYTETFESTSATRNCWNLVSNNTANVGGTNGMGFVTIDNREVLRFSSYSSANDYNQYGFSPVFNASADATNLSVSVVYGTRSSDYLYFGYINGNDTVWDPTAYNTNGSNSAPNWQTYTTVIPATATQLAVHYYGSYAYYAWIDSVTVSEMTEAYCYAVTGLTATPASYEVALTWDDANNDGASYSVLDATGTPIATGITGNNYTVTGLTPETSYTFAVVANCSATSASDAVSVSTTTLPSCPAPTNLAVTLTEGDATVATLSWTPVGTETAWQICLNDDTNYIDVTTNPYTLTGLTAEQTYTAKVRANCDVDDQSAWSNTVTFEPTTKLVIGSGNGTNSYLPTYTLYNYSMTQQIYTAAELGDAGLIESIDFYNTSANARTRTLDVYVVSTTDSIFADGYSWIAPTAADLQYSGSVTFAPGAWTTINLDGFVYDGQSNIAIIVDDNTGTWESSTSFKVFSAPSQALRIYSDGTNYDVTASYSGTVENVKNQIRLVKSAITGCMKPQGVTVTYNGGTSAIVSWTSEANAWNLDINGTVTYNVTANPDTITGLDLGTTYTIRVQAACGNDTSEWTNPISFTTDNCMPEDQCQITIYAQDSYGDGWNGNTINVYQNGALVESYSMASQSMMNTVIYDTAVITVCAGMPISFNWVSGGTYSYPDEVSFTIANALGQTVINAAGTDMTEGVFLTLDSCNAASTYEPDSMKVTVAVNDATMGTTVPAPGVHYFYEGDTASVVAVPNNGYHLLGWTLYVTMDTTVALDTTINYAVDNVFDLFQGGWVVSHGDNIYEWTVTANFEADPTCMPVTDLTVDSITESSVTISWTDSTAASYDVYNGSTFVANVTTNTYTFTGLADGTAYTFGVMALCSATDSAEMVTVNATTNFICNDITTLPYNEGFENGVFGCWTTVNGSSDGQPWNVQTAFSSGTVAPHAGTYMAASWSWNSSAMHADAWLISPKFVLPSINAGDSLTFSWWEKTNTSYPDSYSVAVSTTTNDTASFTVVRPHTAAVGDWTMQSIDLTAYAGQSVYVAFHHVDYDENYLLIDDISLFQGAYVPPAPDTLTVTFATANAAMGTTNPAPGTYQYLTGDTVRFSALPNAGYHFAGWIWEIDGDVDTLDADYISASFPVSTFAGTYDSMTFTALFEAGNPDSTTITYAVNDATMGTITPAPGTYTIYVGNAIEATATPNNGYVLDAWLFDIYLSGTLYSSDTITSADEDFDNPMFFGTLPQSFADYDATITITAVFAADTTGPQPIAMLNLTMDVNDTAMGTTIPAPGLHQIPVYDTNQSTTLWAVPNAGYSVEKWVFIGERLNGTVEYDTLTPTNSMGLNDVYFATNYTNVTYKAIFTEDSTAVGYHTYTILVNDSTMGYVSVTSGAAPHNSAVIIDAYAHDGYHFVSWSNGETNPQLIFYLTMDTTFTAYFAPDEVQETITVTFDVNDATMGTVNPSGTVELVCGSTVTITATAFEGYENYAWKVRMGTDSTIVESNPGSVVTWEYVIPQGASAYVDNIVITAMFRTVTGIQDVDLTNVNIYSTDSRIIVNGAEGRDVTVFDVTGRVIDRKVDATDHVEFSLTNTGAYLVKVGNAPAKRVVVVR